MTTDKNIYKHVCLCRATTMTLNPYEAPMNGLCGAT